MEKLYDRMIDLHNHTTFSDGEDTVEEIIKNAIDYEIKIVGISDHYHLINDIDMYFRIIEHFQKKYGQKIKVLKGIEIDITRLSNPINLEIVQKSDYVLIENLEYMTDLKNGLEIFRDFLKKFNGIVGLAHINFERLIERFGKDEFLNLLTFMEENDICWEINSNYENQFYNQLLYNRTEKINQIIEIISNHNIRIISGSDTHTLYYYNYKRLSDANNFDKKEKIE